ncbi:hypothetical protein AA0113_g1302 [Alternaria arborescens]|uniref:F-box domain-containing protein n=1 Tax=Alternaria arborescens TaxID=156630 RepID=A0A4Q4SNB3_9PLEO|nr:hypothetical protein AA0111_g6291 [Alternaria arborescens]RYN35811.1 hypothetical protein AA0112_g4969 [Alternaria arborescens]RYO29246.1 hypothetical protein AA0111_g6291 [Alternaria arborescens]RYO72290.1 hypothetical protein AA0113_g1302 [Alternaria arborescens]
MSRPLGPTTATAFDSLPIELNKAIVHELDNDKDIANYRLICHSTNDAIDADRLSFWRAKYREKYDFKDGLNNLQLCRVYQRRSKQLRRGIKYPFFHGIRQGERQVVNMLKDMINESFQGATTVDEHGRLRCKNHAHILDFILRSRLLNTDRRAPDTPPGALKHIDDGLAAVKLMCSQFVFNIEGLEHNIFAFEESQHTVYLSASAAPLFNYDHTKLNLGWMLHAMSFFRHHMMNENAQTLFDRIEGLDATQKPSAWREQLKIGVQPLSKYWKGTYSFLDNSEVQKLRRQGPGKQVYIDKNVDEGKIQSLELVFAEDSVLPDGRRLPWPSVFEDRLRSLTNDTGKQGITTQGRSLARSTASSIQFEGKGEDLDDEYMALGWLNILPPQGGIPGWQRITFMKHFTQDYNNLNEDNLWAYEGVVLPGGRIILGRWWFASEQGHRNLEYNGPFILWAVDEPDMEDNDSDNCSDEGL